MATKAELEAENKALKIEVDTVAQQFKESIENFNNLQKTYKILENQVDTFQTENTNLISANQELIEDLNFWKHTHDILADRVEMLENSQKDVEQSETEIVADLQEEIIFWSVK